MNIGVLETSTPWKQPADKNDETVIYAEAEEEENIDYGRLSEAQSNGIYFDVEHKGQFLEPFSNQVDRRCSIVSTTSSMRLMPFLDCMEPVQTDAAMPFLSSTSISPSDIAKNIGNEKILPTTRNISPIAAKETKPTYIKSKISMAKSKKMKSLSDMKFNLL
jgi:hypothetical protein